jgi:hypothetical protein
MPRSRTGGCGGYTCLLIVFIVINILLGGIATQYVVEYWGSRMEGRAVHAPFLPCAIVGLIGGEITIPAAGITWLFSRILDNPKSNHVH